MSDYTVAFRRFLVISAVGNFILGKGYWRQLTLQLCPGPLLFPGCVSVPYPKGTQIHTGLSKAPTASSVLQKNHIAIAEIVFTSKFQGITGSKRSKQKLYEIGITYCLGKHLVVFSHGKIINKKFTSVASCKFSKLDSYHRFDMFRKSSVNRPADLLDDFTAQQVSAVLASDRILPANRNSGKIQTRRKSAWILDRELFVNNSMDKIWALKKAKLLQVFKGVFIIKKSAKKSRCNQDAKQDQYCKHRSADLLCLKTETKGLMHQCVNPISGQCDLFSWGVKFK